MSKPLTDSINALTRYANSVTGASDTTLSEAVATLASGYGQGGGYSIDEILGKTFSGEIVCTLSRASAPNIFANTSITAFIAPNLTTISSPNQYFTGCNNLALLSLPKYDGIFGDYLFRDCTSLQVIVLPSANSMFYTGVFTGCTGLQAIDIGNGDNNSFARQNAFKGCTVLTTMVLRKSRSVCGLAYTNNFDNTPFASNGSGGTLYVPSALLSSYQSSNNWSTILGYANNSIQAIEGSYYETHYADGTPIE